MPISEFKYQKHYGMDARTGRKEYATIITELGEEAMNISEGRNVRFTCQEEGGPVGHIEMSKSHGVPFHSYIIFRFAYKIDSLPKPLEEIISKYDFKPEPTKTTSSAQSHS